MNEIVQIFIMCSSFLVTILLSYFITLIIPKQVPLPNQLTGQINFHKILILVILFALGDFYFVSLIPIIKRLESLIIQVFFLALFFIISIITILITIESQKVILDIDISLINRNLQFLKYSLQLILMQEIVVTLFYLNGLITVILGLDSLPGIAFIFNIQTTERVDLTLITDTLPLLTLLLLAGIKGAFLFLHHGSIILVFIALYVIFEEWNERTKETTITYFRIFALGFIIQGMGQIIQTIGLLYSSFFLTPDDRIPLISSVPITLGSFLVLIGALVYFIAFIFAAISLLSNISHMLVPPALIAFYKVIAVLLPLIYSILYGLLFLLNVFWLFGLDGTTIEELATTLETLTHLLDLPAMILLPYTCGLFFLVAYRQSREEKKGLQLSNFVMWTFLSLFLIFGIGNNTMSTVSWFGMLHGPLALLGSITLLYGLSRVADHASRYRRVMKHIRETPDDFLFLAQLGEAERKIKIWEKVDSLVTTGIIKPLVPTNKPPDETKIVAEINSYMAEITAQFKRKRRPTPSGA